MHGAHLTLGRGGMTRTIGIPGTGIYYTSRSGFNSGFHSAHIESPVDPKTQSRANTVAILAAVAIALLVVLAVGVMIGFGFSHWHVGEKGL